MALQAEALKVVRVFDRLAPWLHHDADRVALADTLEALVDGGERQTRAYQLIELDPPLPIEAQDIREIDERPSTAIESPGDDFLFARKARGGQLKLGAVGGDADIDDGAPACCNLVSRRHRGGMADRLEHVVGQLALQQFLELRCDGPRVRVDEVGEAKVLGGRRLGRIDVDADDAPSTAE